MAELTGKITIEGGSADLSFNLRKTIADKAMNDVDAFALEIAEAVREAVLCTPMLRVAIKERDQALGDLAVADASLAKLAEPSPALEPKPELPAPKPEPKKPARRGRGR